MGGVALRLLQKGRDLPAHLAGSIVVAKIYPERLSFYYQDQCVTEHVRRYERHGDFEHPDHARPLLEQLQQRRLNARHHVQKILALVEIYGTEKVTRALQDAHEYKAYSCEYVTNILDQRARQLPEPGALHLTRACDLLELDLPGPDLSIYERLDHSPSEPSNPSNPT